MEAKEYLQQYYFAKLKLDSLKTELFYLETLADGTQGCSFDKPRVDKTPTLEAPFIKYLDRIEKKRKQIDGQITKLLELEEEITEAIATVDDPMIEVVLRERYINCLSWGDIGKKLHYAEAHLYRLHREGLKKIQIKDDSK
jgi:hypothetical protein